MRVRCDVCGVEPATVLCCADEAALCSACNRRVHRANKLAGKHRRLALQQPSSPTNDASASSPLCDVCKERRGIVFCVEDRAILCADCDEPIHSANDLTAKHSRFLLVGAKLSAAELVDQDQIPSPDGSSDAHDNSSSSPAEDAATAVLNGAGGGGGGGGSSISDYLTNICPGWRIEDLLLEDASFASAAAAKQKGRDEQVSFLDADLFDVVAAGARPEKRGAWAQAPHVPQPAWASLEEVVAPPKAKAKQQGHVREWYHSDSDSDVFAVPEISPTPPAKRARPSPFWCL